jgi:hypothetical protein
VNPSKKYRIFFKKKYGGTIHERWRIQRFVAALLTTDLPPEGFSLRMAVGVFLGSQCHGHLYEEAFVVSPAFCDHVLGVKEAVEALDPRSKIALWASHHDADSDVLPKQKPPIPNISSLPKFGFFDVFDTERVTDQTRRRTAKYPTAHETTSVTESVTNQTERRTAKYPTSHEPTSVTRTNSNFQEEDI